MTGDPPESMKRTDLRAGIDKKEAIERISGIVGAFVVLTRQGIDPPSSEDAYRTFLAHQNDTE